MPSRLAAAALRRHAQAPPKRKARRPRRKSGVCSALAQVLQTTGSALQMSCQAGQSLSRLTVFLENTARRAYAFHDEQSIHPRRRQRRRHCRYRRAAGQPASQSGDGRRARGDRRRSRGVARRTGEGRVRRRARAHRAAVARPALLECAPRERRAFGSRSGQRRGAFRNDASRSRTRTARRTAGSSSARTRPTPRTARSRMPRRWRVALFGKKVGDIATVNGKEWEIVKLGRAEAAARASSPRLATWICLQIPTIWLRRSHRNVAFSLRKG